MPIRMVFQDRTVRPNNPHRGGRLSPVFPSLYFPNAFAEIGYGVGLAGLDFDGDELAVLAKDEVCRLADANKVLFPDSRTVGAIRDCAHGTLQLGCNREKGHQPTVLPSL